MDVLENDHYSQGLELNPAELDKLTAKSEIISDYNKISKILDGGVLVATDPPAPMNVGYAFKLIGVGICEKGPGVLS